MGGEGKERWLLTFLVGGDSLTASLVGMENERGKFGERVGSSVWSQVGVALGHLVDLERPWPQREVTARDVFWGVTGTDNCSCECS